MTLLAALLAGALGAAPGCPDLAGGRAGEELPLPVAATVAELPEEQRAAACALIQAPPPAPTAALDRARLGRILDRPEFAHARDRSKDGLLQLLRRLQDWFFSLFESKEALDFALGTREVVLAGALALALAGGIRFLARRRKDRAPEPGPATAAARILEAPTAHLARARAALEADPREAIREGLLALLSALERRRLARPDRVKTNRELAAELPGRGAPAELASQVAALVGWYDRTFYSLAAVDRTEAGAFLDTVAGLQDRLAGAAP